MKVSRIVRNASAGAAIVLLLAGCSSGGGVTSPPPTASQAPPGTPGSTASVITIKDFAFQEPSSVTPGATVTVTNMDSQAHTVTSDDGSSFDVTVKGGGGTATFTAPTKPATYAYHCTFHPSMHGSLVVKGGS